MKTYIFALVLIIVSIALFFTAATIDTASHLESVSFVLCMIAALCGGVGVTLAVEQSKE